MKKTLRGFLSAAILLSVSACSSEKPPFEAEYTSPNDVTLTYLGKSYQLNRFQQNDEVPFQYSFESDGDLDVIIDGEEYEVDSPYDVDTKKSTKKKKKKSYTTKKRK